MIRVSPVSVAAVFAGSLFVGSADAQAPTSLTAPSRSTVETRQTETGPPAPVTSGPLRLTPRWERPAASADKPDSTPSGTRLSPSPQTRTVSTTPSATPVRKSIQVEGLSALDPNSIGTLSSAEGGFGTDMWQGTPRALIEKLMPALPYAVRSPVLRDLMRRLLLSSATMPEPEPDAPAADGSDLLSLRVSLLQSMGAFKDAVKLTSIIPTRDEDPMLLRLQAQDRLFANDFGSACQIVGGTGDHLQQPYWQQLLVFCQTLSGDTEGAALGASLLIERMGNDDAAFFELIDRLTQATDQPFTSLAKPSALHLAAMRTAQITIPDDAATTLNPAILRTIGVSPNARLETRLAAAESAVSYGALTMDRLSEIYMAEKYDPAELNNALSLAAADRSPRGRALLFQAAQIESVDLAKAAVISKAFEIGAEEGRYLHVIHLYRTLLADLSAATELNWFAAEASRALYALNRPLRARTWVEVLRRSATRNEESRSLLDSLWFLAFLTDSETASSDIEAGLASWLDHHAKRGTPEDSLRAAAGLRLLEALGHEVPDAAWWQLLQNPLPRAERSVNPIAHTALERAAAAGRRGETVMLVLLAFDGAGPRIDDLETAAVAVRALRQVGLEDEAKALALEFAVTGGL